MKNILIFFCFLAFVSYDTVEKTTSKIPSFSNLALPLHSRAKLEADFDLLVQSLQEAHTGLYWYSTPAQFDSLVATRRALLRENLNSLQFYNIVAPIVAFSKEDHCDITLSEDVRKTMKDKGLFMPLIVINLQQKPLILNPPFTGFELVSVNGEAISDVYQKIFNTFAADGFIQTSKYRYLDFRGLAREYAKVIDQPGEIEIVVRNPATGTPEIHTIKAVSAEELIVLHKQVLQAHPIRGEIEKPAQLAFTDSNLAILTFRTFNDIDFKLFKMNFKQFVDESFAEIARKQSGQLIIDMRDNGGGSEGNEDYLFSYLTDKPYRKYKYIELSRFSFSFIPFTDYSGRKDRKALEEELRRENALSPDGKIYRKPGVLPPAPLKDTPFRGAVYVLTSGWTYSGASEFTSLMREHTKAVFIGEETGGGYYGNTSGTVLTLTLPTTKLNIDIPILKFALDVNQGIPGRGVLPHVEIEPTFDEFIRGYDAELAYARKHAQP